MVTTAAVVSAAAASYGAYSSAQSAKEQANIAKQAANTPAATVDIPGLQAQAQEIARQNAANSAALEQQYNPGAAELRAGGLSALNSQLSSTNPQLQTILNQITAQAGSAPQGVSYNSPLLQQAINQAGQDLTLGGQLPKDVQNLVARQALARSGSTTQGLGLGRDITARDLGLTSLQLAQQRLQNAASIGQQQSTQGLANAGYDLQSQLAGTNNLFNSANFLQSMDSGAFQKALAAAQLGQNISMPASGLDPGSVANLAVGNSNATNQAQQQALALQAQAAAAQGQLGGQLVGAGASLANSYFNRPASPGTSTGTTTSYIPPATNYGNNTNSYLAAGGLNSNGGFNWTGSYGS